MANLILWRFLAYLDMDTELLLNMYYCIPIEKIEKKEKIWKLRRVNIKITIYNGASYKTFNKHTLKILLQSGAKVITKWGSFCYYKAGQNLLQSGAAFLLQSEARFITKWGRYYKVGQVLQSGAIIKKRGITLWIKFLRKKK